MKNIRLLVLFLTGTLPLCSEISAQQLPISIFQRYEPGVFNAANSPIEDQAQLFLIQQQRDVKMAGFNSGASFFQLQSNLKGKSKSYSWGIQITHDREHTEQRLAISPTISAKLLQRTNSFLSVGVSGGILNWNSNYSQSLVEENGDPLLVDRSNFLELDAGLGLQFRHYSKRLNVNAEVFANQLPGNRITNQLPGLRISPHLQAKVQCLFNPVYNLNIGPLAWYGDVFNRADTSFQTGLLELGLRSEFERQGLWFAGSYRLDQSALSIALGLETFKVDTLERPDRAPFQVDLQFGFSMPMKWGQVYGPTAEVGFVVKMGRVVHSKIDTLRRADEAFYIKESSLALHKNKYLVPNGPKNLVAQREILPKYIYITYGFPDNSLSYVGETPIYTNSELKEIGLEWEGVNPLMENLLDEVILRALHPDKSKFLDPENLEALESIKSIQLSSKLRVYGFALGLSSDVVYEGEVGYNNSSSDTLFIESVVDERDTVIGISSQRFMTNLELAVLKLHVLRLKLEYDLRSEFDEDFDVLREEDWGKEPIDDLQLPIIFKKMRITSDHPNQQAFQFNEIELKFQRGKRFRPKEEDDGWQNYDEWKREREESRSRRRKAKIQSRSID